MKIKHSIDDYVINGIAYVCIGIIAIFSLIPFIMLVSNSFSSESMVIKYGYGLLPRKFSTSAYEMIFYNWEKVARAYGVTIFVTIVGSLVSLFLSTMYAYVISRKEFKYRNIFSFYIYFTTLFSGGLVSSYIINVNYLHLKNNLLALILIPLLNVFNIIILRSFITGSVPDSLPESAKIDGANDFIVFIKIVLPLLKPAIATIGLFTALSYWNDWYNSMLYMSNYKLYSLQYVLYQLLQSVSFMMSLSGQMQDMASIDIPSETFKLAMTVIAVGPVVLFYPFVQKYFVKGITIGAVKG